MNTSQNNLFKNKKALLLDMNSTLMFGEDRFDESEDFSIYYSQLGGTLPKSELTRIIRAAYDYLDIRYPDEKYQQQFPTLRSAIGTVIDDHIGETETNHIINTFAFHELGHIPQAYREALFTLKKHFTLALVIDIWAPKDLWLNYFDELGISPLFSAMSFSSEHGMVKPSPKPFQQVIKELEISPHQALVIGDSARRDLGGAQAAGIECVLVGDQKHPDSVSHYENLLQFCQSLQGEKVDTF